MRKLFWAILLTLTPLCAHAQVQSYVARTSSLPHSWAKLVAGPRFLTAAVAGRVDYNPVISPDRKLALFSRSFGNANAALYTVAVTGGEPQLLSRKPLPIDQTRPNWSARTGQIAFTGCTQKPGGAPSCGIWLINGNGTHAHAIAIKGASDDVLYPSWYPDGRHIALMDGDNLVIRRLDIVTGATMPATDHARILTGMPAVSPDGKWIAFAGQKIEGQPYNQNRNNIWLVDRVKNLKPLEADLIQGRAPAWSPDGKYVAFESYRGSSAHYAIFVVKRDGAGLTQVTDYELGAQHPSWSPDGHDIVFAYQARSDPTAWGIAVIDCSKIP
jgi:Tol biopolymer transport system component